MANRVARDRGGEASCNKQGVETRALSLGYMQPTHGIMYSLPTLWVSREGGERGCTYHLTLATRGTDPGAVTFYYTVPIPGSVAAKQPTK